MEKHLNTCNAVDYVTGKYCLHVVAYFESSLTDFLQFGLSLLEQFLFRRRILVNTGVQVDCNFLVVFASLTQTLSVQYRFSSLNSVLVSNRVFVSLPGVI